MPRSHAPDYFAGLADGSALVLDVRPADRIKPRDQATFLATREVCGALGWHYEVAGAPPRSLLANVRWLASYRHRRHHLPEAAAALRAAFTAPAALQAGYGLRGLHVSRVTIAARTASRR
jgi:hypothetical protein